MSYRRPDTTVKNLETDFVKRTPLDLISIRNSRFATVEELTIAAGVVTRTQVNHDIDTQGGAAIDDLDTINGGNEADLIFIRPENSSRDINVTEAGNIEIPSGPDLYLDTTSDIIGLLYDGTNWLNFANPFGRMALIAEDEFSGSDTDETFSNIPQTFRHLLLWQQLRTDRAAVSDDAYLQCNADGGANYDHIFIVGSTAATSTTAAAAGTSAFMGRIAGATAQASNFNPVISFIQNYTNTNSYKTIISLSVNWADVATGNMRITVAGSHWRSTNAITSITIAPATGPNFVANCIFQLYGML